MKKTRIIFYLLSLGLLFLCITGCSNYSEINNVLIVDGIGIDKADDKYIVSFNTYVEDDTYKIIDIEVDDLDKAFSNVYLVANKKIYLSHLNILLLSSNLDNEDISLIINTFNKRDDLRGTFLISLVYDYDKDILENKSLYLVNLIKNNYYEAGDLYPTTFNDVILDYLDLELSYIPVINNDLTIMGMHSIFSEFRYYNLEEAKYLNLILDKSYQLVFDINNEEVDISQVDVCFEVFENNITINLYLSYYSLVSEKEIKNFLEEKIYFLLNQEIKDNYFLDLIKKKYYDYYVNHDDIKISFDLNIYLDKENISNIKGVDIFEKDN